MHAESQILGEREVTSLGYRPRMYTVAQLVPPQAVSTASSQQLPQAQPGR